MHSGYESLTHYINYDYIIYNKSFFLLYNVHDFPKEVTLKNTTDVYSLYLTQHSFYVRFLIYLRKKPYERNMKEETTK